MPAYLDAKYINLVSPKLERFSWKKGNLATCRCCICGDSHKNKSKTRFYFYEKQGNYFVRCHNCGYSTTLGVFLRKIDPNLYRQYCLEAFTDSRPNKPSQHPAEPAERLHTPSRVNTAIWQGIPPLSILPAQHAARRWAESRKILDNKLDLFYYAEDFWEFVARISPSDHTGKEERIVIPIYDQDGGLVGVQGRLLRTNPEAKYHQAKYITIKFDPESPRMWYGLDRVNKKEPIVVVEGPIDSTFLRNAVATLGLSDMLYTPKGFEDAKFIYALDNEPRNKDVVQAMSDLLNAGRTVVVWDRNVQSIKDINDMVARGFRPIEIESMIRTCSYNGLSGTLALNRWRKD